MKRLLLIVLFLSLFPLLAFAEKEDIGDFDGNSWIGWSAEKKYLSLAVFSQPQAILSRLIRTLLTIVRHSLHPNMIQIKREMLGLFFMTARKRRRQPSLAEKSR